VKFTASKMETRLLDDLQSPRAMELLRYLDWRAEDHLVAPPRSTRFRNAHEVGYRWLWSVMDERPGAPNGLIVTFDPRHGLRGSYGLATKPRGRHDGDLLGHASELGSALEQIYESWPHGDPPDLRLPAASRPHRPR
jgi:hypothetical protein